jgi:lysophospholipase L1-like esterase
MNTMAQATGSKLVLCFVPGAVEVSRASEINYFPWDQDLSDKTHYDLGRPLTALKTIAQGLNIPVVDLTPSLKGAPDQPVYFPDSWHWNEKGHVVAAKAIETALGNLGWLEK